MTNKRIDGIVGEEREEREKKREKDRSLPAARMRFEVAPDH